MMMGELPAEDYELLSSHPVFISDLACDIPNPPTLSILWQGVVM